MDIMRSAPDLAHALVGTAAILWETRGGGPIRTIITGRSVRPTGRYVSIKNNRSMPWESPYEEHLMKGCEAHPDVGSFLSQPHMLEILVGRRSLVYYPDLRIDYGDGSVEIVEVSSDKDRRKVKPEYRAKIYRAKSIYEELLGWRFAEIQGETIGTDPAYANMDLVQRYRRTKHSVRDEAVVAGLSKLGDPFPFGTACQALGGYTAGKAILLAMMVRGIVAVELHKGTIHGETPMTYAAARRRSGPPGGVVRPLPGRMWKDRP